MSGKAVIFQMARANRMAAMMIRGNAQKLSKVSSYDFAKAAAYSRSLRMYSSENPAGKPKATDDAGQNLADNAGSQSPQDVITRLTEEVEKLNVQTKELKEQNDELMNKYKRSLADSENLRMRLNKQIDDAKIFGIQSFCKDLLEVADTLGHATDSVSKEQLESNPSLKTLYDGLIMTKASLLQVFKRHGLEQINPINQKFDPNVHEALFQKEDSTVAPDIVVAVTKLGYKLHDRCIRPALVGVSKHA